MTNDENGKYIEEKERKLRKEVEKIKLKQDNETNAFNMKMNSTYGEFKKNRATEFDQ